MSKDSSKDDKVRHLNNRSINLPDFSKYQEGKHSCLIDETNVVRVPFGVRLSKKKRPQKNQNIATLILPITSCNNPSPPPYVA